MSDKEEGKSLKQKGAVQALMNNYAKTDKFRKLAMPVGLPPAYQAMLDNMQWVRDMATPSYIRPFLEMQEQMKSVQEMLTSPVQEFMSTIHDITQPFTKLQNTLLGVQNSAAVRMFESLKGITDSLPQGFVQGNVPDYASFVPNVGIDLPETFWEDLDQEDEEDLESVAKILQGVELQKSSVDDAINSLLGIAKENLLVQQEILEEQKKHVAAQQETNRHLKDAAKSGTLSLIISVLSILLTIRGDFKIETSSGVESHDIEEDTLQEISHLMQVLVLDTKETTARLNLRTSPDTATSENILLTIPKGESVMIMQSINHWCKVQYVNPETGYVRYGWVSKRYLN